MTTLWGTLETTVNVAISKLAGYEKALDYRAVIMVAHSTFQQRVDIVSALCDQLLLEFPNLSDYKHVVGRIKAAQKARNRLAHNTITMLEETGEVFLATATARGSLKTTVETVNLSDIRDATAKIHEAMCALHTLVTGHELKPIWEREA